jgi:hypothetical protein
LRPALFDNNNRLITLSGGYKNLHYLSQFIVTTFYVYKKQQNLFKNLCSVACCLFVCLYLVVPECIAHAHNACGSLLLYLAHHDEEFVELLASGH